MVVFVAAADTVDDGYVLWLRTIFEDDFATGRSYGITDSLELKASNNIGEFAVAVLNDGSRIKWVIAGGDDYITHIYLDDFVLLLEIDSLSLAELLTGTAFTFEKVVAALFIYNRNVWHCLRKWGVDSFSLAQAEVELAICFPGTFLHAYATAITFGLIHIASLLADFGFEVTDEAGDFLYLAVSHQFDIGV